MKMTEEVTAARVRKPLPAPPCEALNCPHVEKCEALRLACPLFLRYTKWGRNGADVAPEKRADRMIPKRSIYLKVFTE